MGPTQHTKKNLYSLAVLLAIVCAAIVLGGCALMPPRDSDEGEPPFVGGDNNPTPRPVRSTPTVVNPPGGDDAPVSSGQKVTPAQVARPKITGRVRTVEKEPVADAVVAITRGTGPFPERTYLTDAEGVYNIVLPSGTYTVAVIAEGFKRMEQQVMLPPDADAILDFELEAE